MANVLGELFGDIASAIREKTGDAEKMKPADFPEKIGGLANTSGVTATAEDVLEGKTIVDADGNEVAGTMPNVGTVEKKLYAGLGLHTGTPGKYVIPEGYHDGSGVVTVETGEKTVTPTKTKKTIIGDQIQMGYVAGMPNYYSKFLSRVTVEPIPDQYQDVSGVTATADDVRAGKVFVDATGNKVSGSMDVSGVDVSGVTATEEDVLEGKMFVDSSGVLKEGTMVDSDVDVSGVTATAEDVRSGKIFVDAEGNEVTGTMSAPDIQLSDITATEDSVMVGKMFIDSTGTLKEGKIWDRGTLNVQLYPEYPEHDISRGMYAGGYVRINPEEKTVTPTKEPQIIVPSEKCVLSKVTVEPIDESMFDVSEVTAKAEDVLEGKVIVTSTGNKVYGALAVDDLEPGEMVVFKKQKVSGFVLDSNLGAYSPGYAVPSAFSLEEGKTYRVNWDGVDYECVSFTFEMNGYTFVTIGNASSFGLQGNGEPFLMTQNITADNTQIFAADDKDTHTIGIYTEAVSDILLQEKTVTENGVVEPDEGFDGLGKVIVDVLASGGELVGKRGTFSCSSKIQTITHGLGAVPMFVWLKTTSGIVSTDYACVYCAIGVNETVAKTCGFTEDAQYAVYFKTDGKYMQMTPDKSIETTDNYTTISMATENTIRFGDNSYGLKTGYTYQYTIIGLK